MKRWYKEDEDNRIKDDKVIDSSTNRYKKDWSVNINNSKEVKGNRNCDNSNHKYDNKRIVER